MSNFNQLKFPEESDHVNRVKQTRQETIATVTGTLYRIGVSVYTLWRAAWFISTAPHLTFLLKTNAQPVPKSRHGSWEFCSLPKLIMRVLRWGQLTPTARVWLWKHHAHPLEYRGLCNFTPTIGCEVRRRELEVDRAGDSCSHSFQKSWKRFLKQRINEGQTR